MHRDASQGTALSYLVRESAKKVQRFLTLGVFHLSGLWFGILQVFRNEQLRSGNTVYVAIPLYWQRLETLGNSHDDEQTAFLAIALPRLDDYRVGVLGDREL